MQRTQPKWRPTETDGTEGVLGMASSEVSMFRAGSRGARRGVWRLAGRWQRPRRLAGSPLAHAPPTFLGSRLLPRPHASARERSPRRFASSPRKVRKSLQDHVGTALGSLPPEGPWSCVRFTPPAATTRDTLREGDHTAPTWSPVGRGTSARAARPVSGTARLRLRPGRGCGCARGGGRCAFRWA